MLVQTQPLPSLGEHRNRANPHFEASGLLVSGASIPRTLVDDFQQQQEQALLGAAQVSNAKVHRAHNRAIPRGASPMFPVQGKVVQNFTRTYGHDSAIAGGAVECANIPTMAVTINGGRKRCRGSIDTQHAASLAHPKQIHLQQLGAGLNLNQTVAPFFPRQVGHLVSTGLRLALDDEPSTVTSSRTSTTSACGASITLRDELAAQVSSQQDDLNQLLLTQAEQLRRTLEERMRVHAKARMATVEDEASRKLREKEAEMERECRRNAELEERVRQLSMEREVWQSKAKDNEAMVVILKSNLQQAMAQVQHQSQEPCRMEGCGDSEADDAASVYIDDNLSGKQSRAMVMMKSSHISASSEMVGAAAVPPVMAAMVRLCRHCGAREASVLLLPCLHLCLCLDCHQNNSAERCPLCNTLVGNSVEVLLS